MTNTELRASAVPVDGSGVTQPVSGTVAVSSLPAGLATSALQSAIGLLLGAGLPSALVSDRLKVDGSGVTQPVSAAALPLPSNAAQETGGNLAAILTALGLLLPTTDFDSKTGGLTETAPGTDTGSSGLNGRLQRIAQRLTSLIALLPASLAGGGGLKVEGVAGGVAQPVSEADGANVVLGAKADAKSAATDATAITMMQVLKQISASVQAPPSQAVTNAGVFATQAAVTAALNAIVDGAIVTLGAKADAKNTATDATAITIMQVLKQISASVQAPPSQAVTNAGIFAVQADTELPTAAALSDAFANPTTPMVGAGAMLYDPVAGTWRRQATYNRVVGLPLLSRAAGSWGIAITPGGMGTLTVYVSITVPGSSTFTFLAQDSSGGYRYLTAAANLTTAVNVMYVIGKNAAVPAAGTTSIVQAFAVPLLGNFMIYGATTNTSTFSIEYELSP